MTNDYKVGDLVVYVNSINPGDNRLFKIDEVHEDDRGTWSIRPATPEEIKVGHRIELSGNTRELEILDMVDVPPTTIVVDL